MSQQTTDPWDLDKEPEQGPKVYFGEVSLVRHELYWDYDAHQWFVFDPSQHRVSDKVHQVKLGAICTKRDGSAYDIDREDKIEWLPSPWITIANKSLKALGIRYTELDEGRWCKFELIKTGQSYISKTTKERVEKDFFSFLEFYPDEATCRTAEAAFYNRTSEPEDEPLPFESNEDADKARADAAAFLDTIWKLAGKDADAFYAAISNQPSLAAHFDSNSPEVIEIVEGAAPGGIEESDIPY